MFREDTSCIILAGGLGTRLRGSIGDIPKCMAPVAGKPFLHYILSYLQTQDIDRVMLSLGFRAELVLDWLPTQSWSFSMDRVVETEPLGTGGGISLALQACTTPTVFVVNGDTFFDVDLQRMHRQMLLEKPETMLALKQMEHFERYGTVRLAADGRAITGFREKRPTASGLINGGIYCIDRNAFLQRRFPQKFSFEKDYLETSVAHNRLQGFVSNGYFIDIGVPEDFQRAQTDFQILFPA